MKNKHNFLVFLITSLVFIVVFLVLYILRTEVNDITVLDKSQTIVDSLSLNSREKDAIKEMQSTTLKYGEIPDNRIYSIVAEEIATAFSLDAEALEYKVVDDILEDVSSELLDFTVNIFPTDESLEKFDYSIPISDYKVYFFFDNSRFDSFDLDSILLDNKKIKIGYTKGFLYDELLEKTYNRISNITLEPVSAGEDIVTMLSEGQLDFFAGDTGFYSKLSQYTQLSVTSKTYIDEVFMHLVTRHDSNPYFMTAVNKLLEHEEFRSTIIRKINNYRSDLVKNSVKIRVGEKSDETTSSYKILVREFEPFSYTDEDGLITGAHIEIIKKILDEANVNYVASYIDEKRTLKMTDEEMAEYDIVVPALINVKNNKNFFTTSEIDIDEQVVFGQDDKSWDSYKSIHDLYSYRIGVVENIFYNEYLEENLYTTDNIFTYSSLEQLINAIKRGEIDLGLYSENKFNHYAYENTIVDIIVYKNISIEPMRFAYYFRDIPSVTKYVPEFNMFLENIDTESITKPYVGKNYSIYNLYDEQTKIISVLAVVITVLSFLLIVTFSVSILRVLHRSNYDTLTKIRNGKTLRYFIERYKFNKDIAIAYIDVRDLKSINDIYGEDVGNKALVKLSANLQQMSKDNKVFRVDGDEFLVIYNYRVFDFRDEIKNIFNVSYNINGEEVFIGGSMSIINLSKFGDFKYIDILNILNYTMRIAKGLGYIKSIDVDDYFVDEYFKMEKLRKVVTTNVDKGNVDSVIIPIRYKNKLAGGILQPIFTVDSEVFNLNKISIGKYNVLPTKLLNDVSKLLFENLCQIINTVNLKCYDTSNFIHIHEENDKIITGSDINIWVNLMEKYKISNDSVFFKVNPDIFKSLKGLNLAKQFQENNLNIIFKYVDIRAEILAVVNTMEKFVIEIDTEILQKIPSLLENKTKEEIEDLFNENLFIESQINFINSSKCDVLISYTESLYDDFLIDYYKKRIINKKVYYSKKYNEQNIQSYLEVIQ